MGPHASDGAMSRSGAGRGALVLAAVLAFGGCLRPGPPPSTAPSNPSTTKAPPPPSTTAATRIPSTSARTPTTGATSGTGARGLPATDRLEREHRLVQALPHSTPHYRIDFSVGADGRLRVVVTLLAVLNDPRHMAAYQAELRRYKAEALGFIAAQGDDPATYTVTFLPPDP